MNKTSHSFLDNFFPHQRDEVQKARASRRLAEWERPTPKRRPTPPNRRYSHKRQQIRKHANTITPHTKLTQDNQLTVLRTLQETLIGSLEAALIIKPINEWRGKK